jgi:dihydrodipicolinate reductase
MARLYLYGYMYINQQKEVIEMKKFNIGHITGLTVNAAEAMVDKAKKDIPAATNTGKTGIKSWGNAVKDNYKTTRKGEVVVDTEVVFNSFGELNQKEGK